MASSGGSMKTFVVKGILHFPDGVNKGQTEVKAKDSSEAEQVFRQKMKQIWKIPDSDIEVLSVRPR
jgi:muconolactone delta-isomerase